MILSLRGGAKVHINGAVLRVDRKVNIELLNDVTFLLAAHVLQPHEATIAAAPTLFRHPDDPDGPVRRWSRARDAVGHAGALAGVLRERDRCRWPAGRARPSGPRPHVRGAADRSIALPDRGRHHGG